MLLVDELLYRGRLKLLDAPAEFLIVQTLTFLCFETCLKILVLRLELLIAIFQELGESTFWLACRRDCRSFKVALGFKVNLDDLQFWILN